MTRILLITVNMVKQDLPITVFSSLCIKELGKSEFDFTAPYPLLLPFHLYLVLYAAALPGAELSESIQVSNGLYRAVEVRVHRQSSFCKSPLHL